MKSDVIGIEVDGRSIMTDAQLFFSKETRDTEPWIFEALDAKENAHATIAAHVMTECITRSKKVAEALIQADALGDIPVHIDPEHMLPTMMEGILWRPGPVDGEIEVCTISGAPQVCEEAVSEEDGDRFMHLSHPDMGTIGCLTKMALEDIGGDEWKLLSFMSAGSDKADKILPSGETVEANVIVNEIVCPMDPHERQHESGCGFYMATYALEVAEGDDDGFIIRDHLDEGKKITDLESMGFASQHQFDCMHASMIHPLHLAGCIIDRLQTKPYQSMLDATGVPTQAAIRDKMAGMMFVTGLFHPHMGFEGTVSKLVVPMMTASYTDAAGILLPIINELTESLDENEAADLKQIADMLKDACIAFNLFEWSLCALSDSLHRADPLKWNRLRNLIIEIEGTDA